jgi:hypothetical protein
MKKWIGLILFFPFLAKAGGWVNEPISVMVLSTEALSLHSARVLGFFESAVFTYYPDEPQDGRLILDPGQRKGTMISTPRMAETKDNRTTTYYAVPIENLIDAFAAKNTTLLKLQPGEIYLVFDSPVRIDTPVRQITRWNIFVGVNRSDEVRRIDAVLSVYIGPRSEMAELAHRFKTDPQVRAEYGYGQLYNEALPLKISVSKEVPGMDDEVIRNLEEVFLVTQQWAHVGALGTLKTDDHPLPPDQQMKPLTVNLENTEPNKLRVKFFLRTFRDLLLAPVLKGEEQQLTYDSPKDPHPDSGLVFTAAQGHSHLQIDLPRDRPFETHFVFSDIRDKDVKYRVNLSSIPSFIPAEAN